MKIEVECWLTLYAMSTTPLMAGRYEWSATYKGQTGAGEEITVEVAGMRGPPGEEAVAHTRDMLRENQRFLITIEPAEVAV